MITTINEFRKIYEGIDLSKLPETPAMIKTSDPKILLGFFQEQRAGLKHGYDQMRKSGGPLTDTEKEYLSDIRSYDKAISFITAAMANMNENNMNKHAIDIELKKRAAARKAKEKEETDSVQLTDEETKEILKKIKAKKYDVLKNINKCKKLQSMKLIRASRGVEIASSFSFPFYLTKKGETMLNSTDEISEGLKHHIDNGLSLAECVYRFGSPAHFELVNEMRKMHNEGKIELSACDAFYVKSDIGQKAVFENKEVWLDMPAVNEAEYQGKEVELNSPKRGGSKKFYVYVKNDNGNIIKVQFGDTTGLTAKINDPEARKSFAARHQCDTKKDKTKAGYWACRLPYYAKQLGLSGGGNYYW